MPTFRQRRIGTHEKIRNASRTFRENRLQKPQTFRKQPVSIFSPPFYSLYMILFAVNRNSGMNTPSSKF